MSHTFKRVYSQTYNTSLKFFFVFAEDLMKSIVDPVGFFRLTYV